MAHLNPAGEGRVLLSIPGWFPGHTLFPSPGDSLVLTSAATFREAWELATCATPALPCLWLLAG